MSSVLCTQYVKLSVLCTQYGKLSVLCTFFVAILSLRERKVTIFLPSDNDFEAYYIVYFCFLCLDRQKRVTLSPIVMWSLK